MREVFYFVKKPICLYSASPTAKNPRLLASYKLVCPALHVREKWLYRYPTSFHFVRQKSDLSEVDHYYLTKTHALHKMAAYTNKGQKTYLLQLYFNTDEEVTQSARLEKHSGSWAVLQRIRYNYLQTRGKDGKKLLSAQKSLSELLRYQHFPDGSFSEIRTWNLENGLLAGFKAKPSGVFQSFSVRDPADLKELASRYAVSSTGQIKSLPERLKAGSIVSLGRVRQGAAQQEQQVTFGNSKTGHVNTYKRRTLVFSKGRLVGGYLADIPLPDVPAGKPVPVATLFRGVTKSQIVYKVWYDYKKRPVYILAARGREPTLLNYDGALLSYFSTDGALLVRGVVGKDLFTKRITATTHSVFVRDPLGDFMPAILTQAPAARYQAMVTDFELPPESSQ